MAKQKSKYREAASAGINGPIATAGGIEALSCNTAEKPGLALGHLPETRPSIRLLYRRRRTSNNVVIGGNENTMAMLFQYQ